MPTLEELRERYRADRPEPEWKPAPAGYRQGQDKPKAICWERQYQGVPARPDPDLLQELGWPPMVITDDIPDDHILMVSEGKATLIKNVKP